MIIKIDFNSDEALYIQLRNQIVMGIATSQLTVGDSLPSVRQLADHIGINMVLASQQIMNMLQPVLAEAMCKNVGREEVHEMVDAIYDAFMHPDRDDYDEI